MKKPVKVVLIILASLLVIAGAFLVYVLIDTAPLKDVSHLQTEVDAMNPQTVSVEGVKLLTQPDGFTCGETTICVTASFCGQKEITPQELITQYQTKGSMNPARFVEILSQELPGYTVTYRHNLNDAELLQGIHDQLQQGIPVPVFFGAPNPFNKPYYDFHASVVTGLDLAGQQVTIANVYGYEEKISLTDFINRMSYRGTGNYPFVQKAVLKLGMMDKNTYIMMEKK